MAEITASMVRDLRELTGLGMMECKKALEEAAGDMKKAEELLRIKSGAKASKAASRVAAEGAIGTYLSADGKLYTCLFSAKGHDLRALLRAEAPAAVTDADRVAWRDAAVRELVDRTWRVRVDRYSEVRTDATAQNLPRVEMFAMGG